MMKGHIKYFCLQATREGQASYAHVHEIITGLRRRDWQVKLFDPSYSNVHWLPSSWIRMVAFLKTYISLFQSNEPTDVLYIRSHFAAIIGVVWAKLCRIPIVIEVNGSYDDLFIAWPWTKKLAILFKWLTRSQLKWADAVIAVTPQLKSWVIRESGQNLVYVISNGANINIFNPQAPDDLQLSQPYVVFFGAMAPWQGIDTMLAAVECPAWPETVNLVFVGDGVERHKIDKKIVDYRNVKYLGIQPYKKLPGIINQSLAGLSIQNNLDGRSYRTGLYPLKVFETLACGVPVIVSDFPGQANLVREGHCGLVIPPEDPNALAKAVAYLQAHPEERKKMGQTGRQLIEQEHSWDKRASVTEEVLLNLLNNLELVKKIG